MSDDADTLIRHQGTLATNRSTLETWWQDIGYRVLPSQATFTTRDVEGSKRNERLFTGRPVIANERFAAVAEDMLTPRNQVWQALVGEDEYLADDQAAQVWFEEVTKILFGMRNRPGANFYSQRAQGYLSLGAFGNSCLFIDEIVGGGVRYIQCHMSGIYWAENYQGVVDTIYRKMRLQKRQVEQRAKADGWQIPKKVTEETDPFKEFEFIHCVKPNEERKHGRLDAAGMPWSSYVVSCDEKSVISHSGYTSWPYAISRYTLGPGEVYGRSPAMAAWSAIMTLNEEKKSILRAGQLEVEPVLLLSEDGALEPFSLRPSALNHGMLSADGTALVQTLKTGANIPLGLELMQLENTEIEDSFLVSIFKILAENPQMTATQVLEVAQERGVMLAPVMGRAQAEDLGPQTERELDIAAKAGLLPEMPDSLMERGANYKIEYRSPLARAQRAPEGTAILRTLETLSVAAQIDQNAAAVVDIPESLRELAKINGMPAKLIRDKAQYEAIIAQQQEDAQLAQAAEAAPGVTQASLNAAKADQLRAGYA